MANRPAPQKVNKPFRHSSTFYRKVKSELRNNNNSSSSVEHNNLKNYFCVTKQDSGVGVFQTRPQQTVQGKKQDSVLFHTHTTGEVFSAVIPGLENPYNDETLSNFIPEADGNDEENNDSIGEQINLAQQLREWALIHKCTLSSLSHLMHIRIMD